MKSLFLASMMISSLALAEKPQAPMSVRTSGEIEVSCRSKAKEIAADTYRSCVTDQKNAQIEQIKKEYQAKLQALKAHYEQELKKMNGSKSKSAAATLEESDSNSPASSPAAPAMTEESNGASVKAPEPAKTQASKPSAKKSAKAVAAKAKKLLKKSSAPAPTPAASEMESEMTVQLKPAPITPAMDESVMDLPEPIPVDDVKAGTSI